MGIGMVKLGVLQLVNLGLVCFALALQGSNGFSISPSPETSSVIPPIQEKLGPVSHEKSFENNEPSSASQPTGSFPHLEPALPPLPSEPAPNTTKGLVPSLPPSVTTVLPPANTAPPPLPLQRHAPSTPASNTTKGLVPSLPPSVTTVLPPSVTTVLPPANTAPPPLPLQRRAPSTPASNTAQGPVPSLPPSVTTVLPPSSTAPPPLTLQGHAPSTPAPNTTKGLVPSLPPSVTTVLPPSNNAPPPLALRGHAPSTPTPNTSKGLVPSSPPNITTVLPPSNTVPPPLALQGHVPIMQPIAPQEKPPVTESPISVPLAPGKAPVVKAPISVPVAPAIAPTAPRGKAPVTGVPISTPVAPVPVATPSRSKSLVSPAVNPSTPETSPSSAHQGNSSANKGPISEPITPVPVASPSQGPRNSTSIHPATPGRSPSTTPDHEVSPASSPPPSIGSKKDEPVAAPSYVKSLPSPPPGHTPTKAPANNKPERNSHVAPSPSILSPKSPSNRGYHPPASSPSTSYFNRHTRNKSTSPPPASSYISPASEQEGPVTPPASLPRSRQIQYAPPPHTPGFSVSPSHNPFSPPLSYVSPAPSPSSENTQTFHAHSPKGPKVLLQPPLQAFPPPPPNEDCSAIICTEPNTNTPPGSPCGCVLPIQIGLRLSVALYTFFPLVAELAQEVAVGVFIKQSQVRIIGANAATQQPEKTVVLIDLVPLGEMFDNTTAFLIFQRFWQKQVAIQASFFGGYEVLYVRYPGLPPSPPSADGSIIDDGPYAGTDSNARTIKPLGVNVHKGQHKNRITGGIVAIIVLSALLALVLCSAAAWVFLFKNSQVTVPGPARLVALPSLTKQTGAPGSVIGSKDSFASLSFGSSIATYTGSAKTFSASDIERATAHFDDSRILGEGGFGRVYHGVLEDGINVAVKVLKRDDQQGGREFLAEVEMLSRLHHRNLVKLIGICIEERARCLVYELIPNGSVESHLHGVDKESAPLNWGARIKIALGAARGLAYLHEDSSPRVIHRDFKSSNILLEDDFTPKVSDFGLARTALDEENQHISTRVMGTFGYVAPEYAMTGHLLVKSDVYSYGVVLLELLSGRKPVDMSQPPGQENLVAWARPLLTSREGLETIIDHSLSDISFDSASKVAAIASMCVQPEVSNRPFMGEVVQALKLVCEEIEEAKEIGSRTSSLEDLSIDLGAAATTPSRQVPDPLRSQYSVTSYESEFDIERGMSVSELFSSSVRLGRQQSESFRRHSSSGPLGSRRSRNFWEKARRLYGGSVSEHGFTIRLWPGSH